MHESKQAEALSFIMSPVWLKFKIYEELFYFDQKCNK